jgi:hypothetical protein
MYCTWRLFTTLERKKNKKEREREKERERRGMYIGVNTSKQKK